MAIGPDERAVGSKEGHGYRWSKRQHCFIPQSPQSFPDMPTGGRENIQTKSAATGDEGTDTVVLSEGEDVGFDEEHPGQT